MIVSAVAVAGRGLVDPAEPVFFADDEAVLRGTAAFETLRVYAGRPFRLPAHLDRLSGSIERLALPPVDRRECEELAHTAIDAAGAGELALRYYRTYRTLIATVGPLPDELADERSRGLRLRTIRIELDPLLRGVKSTSYAFNMAARQDAEGRGDDDAVFVSSDGTVLEGTTANVWWREGEQLFTPSLDLGILPGVTRGALLEIAAERGTRVHEGAFPLDRLLGADEAFVSSSIREVMPVVAVDGVQIGDGRPGEASRALQGGLRVLSTR